MKKAKRIESRTALPAYAPHLPSGTLLHTALVLAHRLGCDPRRVSIAERVYGLCSLGPVNLFGAGTDHVAKSYFADSLSPDQILRQHTLFGFYSLGISVSATTEWARQLRNGWAKGPVRYTRTLGAVTSNKGLRWCLECARSDQACLGFAAWHVVHQLPFVYSCPQHNLPLYVCCQDCKKPLDTGQRYRFPGENCGTCGSSNFTALPQISNPAYLSLISRCDNAIRTQTDDVKPQAWARRVNKFVDSHCSLHAAVAVMSHNICTKWGVKSPEEISEILSFPLGKGYVAGLLRSNTAVHPLVAQLIAADAMPAESFERSVLLETSGGVEYATSAFEERPYSDSLRGRYVKLFVDLGISPVFLYELLSGCTMAEASSRSGVSSTLIKRALADPEGGMALYRIRCAAAFKLKIRGVRERPWSCFEARRTTYLLWLIRPKSELPNRSQAVVYKENGELIAWLRQNDQEWLDKILPWRKPYWRRRLWQTRIPVKSPG